MIPAKTLSLITNFGCDANCAHCSVFSGPKRTDVMDPALVRKLIDEAAEDPEIEMVAYTGGEPTLIYDQLIEHMAYAQKKGLLAGLVSNSNWATDAAIAQARFQELTDRGLTIYITSLDEYHLEYVELQHIRNAVHASLAARVATHLNVLWTPDFAESIARLPETLDLPPEVVDAHGEAGLFVWINRPSRMRRVKGDLPRGPLPIIDEKVAGPCDHIIRHPIVAANGNVHMCCGVADSSPEGPARFSAIGNAGEEPLADILERGRGNLYFNLLAKAGPYAIYEAVRALSPLPVAHDDFTNPCEVCARLQKPDLRPRLAQWLEKVARHEA